MDTNIFKSGYCKMKVIWTLMICQDAAGTQMCPFVWEVTS